MMETVELCIAVFVCTNATPGAFMTHSALIHHPPGPVARCWISWVSRTFWITSRRFVRLTDRGPAVFVLPTFVSIKAGQWNIKANILSVRDI